MAKDLPYFKFYSSEWNDGDITLEDMKTQGLFINICSYYWSQECQVLHTKLQKRFRTHAKQLHILFLSKIIHEDGENIKIKFLDKQWQEREIVKHRNKANGLKGGRPKITQSVNSGLEVANPNERQEEKIREEKKREDIKSKPKSVSRFTPPTTEDVASYCLERNNGVDSIKWHNSLTRSSGTTSILLKVGWLVRIK